MSLQNKQIIALHGAGMHGGVWGNLTLPCWSLSLPGHGTTEGALLPSIEKMAEWVGLQLSGSVVLMGHSMGALVALEAAQHPCVAGLVLMGAAAKMPVHADLLKQAAENPGAAADMILKWGISPAHPQGAALKESLREQMRVVAPGALFNDLSACHAYQRGETAAKAIGKPVLVIAGADDKLTKCADGQALADMIPGAKFCILPACGHMPMVEKPVETAAEINRFMAG